ncbi:MAG TPA: HNH endonuclease signature motif containing protein [Phycisphaerae bacterium]|nr:HNH endonuclease signature motif containing protein [Phycisphaerae bacterium]HWC00650.1 HNH endonuclease signature motif containing protein [Bryobacteraceae bacterium]
MPRIRRDFLRDRAGGRCEYCHFPERFLAAGLTLDHVIAQQHRGGDGEENLAMACLHCNACKGPNIASMDWQSSQVVRLFNPRLDRWDDHFQIVEDRIEGRTPEGRATVMLLDMNNAANVSLRELLRRSGMGIGA